jgi:hypothetical protein
MNKEKRKLIAIVIIVLLFLSGCAGNKMSSWDKVQLASEAEDSEAKTFTTSDSKSNIYIYRERTAGAEITFQVTLDGKSIGYFVPNRYYLLTVEPGKHSIEIITKKNVNFNYNEDDSMVNIDTNPGENYFVNANAWLPMPKTGLLPSIRVKAAQVENSVGMKKIKKSKLVKNLIS